jgi:hypothetical protein
MIDDGVKQTGRDERMRVLDIAEVLLDAVEAPPEGAAGAAQHR